MSQPLPTPLLTGGTGRSGTTVVARMLDNHPDVAKMVPPEIRILTDRDGLCDLVAARQRADLAKPARLAAARVRAQVTPGRTRTSYVDGGPAEVARFVERLLGYWWQHVGPGGESRGLHLGTERATLEAAVDGFPERFAADPAGAAARLVHDALDPVAVRQGKGHWIDTTPDNALRAPGLLRVFPDVRIVHMMRDGRDVASSVSTMDWGPDDFDKSLSWWGWRMQSAYQALRQLPADQVLVVQLEDLIDRDREATYAALLAFWGLPDARPMRRYFDTRMHARRGHVGRWREGMPQETQRRIDARYEKIIAELDAAGVPRPR